MDVQSYMHGIGRAARAASRAMARAETRAKNDALMAMAAAIERDADRLLAANGGAEAEENRHAEATGESKFEARPQSRRVGSPPA